jgi:hypothetical protein
MDLLCCIDQQEKQGECASGDGALVDWQSFNEREQFIEGASIRDGESPSTRSLSKILDCLECLLTFKSVNHATERRCEPPHILVQRHVLSAHRRTRRYLPLYFFSGHGYQDRQDRQDFFLLTVVL